jgi:hypothetical protein
MRAERAGSRGRGYQRAARPVTFVSGEIVEKRPDAAGDQIPKP